MSTINLFLWPSRWSGSGCTMRTDGPRSSLTMSKSHKSKGFICCPCFDCKNQKEHSSTGPIHSHFLRRGFMPKYIFWTKHGEEGIILENDEEEEGGNDASLDVAEYGSIAYTLDDFVEGDLNQMMCD